MAQYVNERQFWAGEHLHRSDERLNELLVVVEGRVAVSGGEYGEGTVGSSEALGLLSLLAKSDEGLDARAEVDTLALEIRAEDLEDVFEDHFDILLSQIRHLARQILQARMGIADGAYLASRARAKAEHPSRHRSDRPPGLLAPGRQLQSHQRRRSG